MTTPQRKREKKIVRELIASKTLEVMVDKMPRHQCAESFGHEYIDTCRLYKMFQRYNRVYSLPTATRSRNKK